MLQNKQVVLLGDFNIKLLATNCPYMDLFMNNLQTLHYLPLITRPTRFPCPAQLKPSPPSLLDHIWTNLAMPVISGILCADLTDHCPTFLLVHNLSNVSDSSRISFRSQKVENYDKFVMHLSRLDWSGELIGDLSNLVESFVSKLDHLYCRNFPLQTKHISKKCMAKPWLSPELLKLIKAKSLYFKLSRVGI